VAEHPLGHVQRHVLLTLSTRGEASPADWSAWHPMASHQVANAMAKLYRRGLVEPVRFEGKRRLWGLTARGLAVVEADDDAAEAGA
jgi:DNA-binding MarR family transcriptional regulator